MICGLGLESLSLEIRFGDYDAGFGAEVWGVGFSEGNQKKPLNCELDLSLETVQV